MRTEPDSPAPADGPVAPFAAEMAFAGPAHWEAPVMRWEHTFDSGVGVTEDIGRLAWEDGVVVERGELTVDGRQVTYREEWVRMTPAGEEPAVERGERFVRVTAGRWEIELLDDRPVGEFVAVRFEVTDAVRSPVGEVRVPNR